MKAIINNIYYCPKATATIISPGALIAAGATLLMGSDNNYRIELKDGKVIHAMHKNQHWFITSRERLNKSYCSISTHHHEMRLSMNPSKVWHARMGHVLMKCVRRLFRKNSEYGLRDTKLSDVTREECLRYKSTRKRTLGSTDRHPAVMEVLVTDIAGRFTP